MERRVLSEKDSRSLKHLVLFLAFPVSLASMVSRHQNLSAEADSERESEVFLPIHLSPLYSHLQNSERSRNSSLTAHAGSQSHLNTSLSCLNIKVSDSTLC